MKDAPEGHAPPTLLKKQSRGTGDVMTIALAARVTTGLDSAVSTETAADVHGIESEKTLSIRQERKHE